MRAIKVSSRALPAWCFVTGWHGARAEAPLETGTTSVALVCVQLLAGSVEVDSAREGGSEKRGLEGDNFDGPLFPGAPSCSGRFICLKVGIVTFVYTGAGQMQRFRHFYFAKVLGEGKVKGWAPFPSWNSTSPSAS